MSSNDPARLSAASPRPASTGSGDLAAFATTCAGAVAEHRHFEHKLDPVPA